MLEEEAKIEAEGGCRGTIDDTRTPPSAEAARADAEAVARTEPVHVALTDFCEWIFFRIVGKVITVSKPVHMFRYENDGTISSEPSMVHGLQYLCAGIGKKPREPGGLAAALSSVRSAHAAAARLVDSVIGIEHDIQLRLACAGAALLREVGLPDSTIEEKLRKRYPDVAVHRVWEVLTRTETDSSACPQLKNETEKNLLE